MNKLPRFARSLVIGAIVAMAIYMLTDGRFLFIPLLFLPALPLFKRQPASSHGSSGDVRTAPRPDAQLNQLPPRPADRRGTPADPRWN